MVAKTLLLRYIIITLMLIRDLLLMPYHFLIYLYTLPFGIMVIILILTNAYQVCIYLINNTVKLKDCEILFQFIITVFYLNIYSNVFLWCKAEFSASLLQSSLSHDPSEITLIRWFSAQETFLIIINVENSYAALIFFLWKLWYYIHYRSTNIFVEWYCMSFYFI